MSEVLEPELVRREGRGLLKKIVGIADGIADDFQGAYRETKLQVLNIPIVERVGIGISKGYSITAGLIESVVDIDKRLWKRYGYKYYTPKGIAWGSAVVGGFCVLTECVTRN